ncbi:hypothetical protein [Clostridium beijerinckii]|uniref:AprE-like beta-barrel domain-containing protein n=1 Tax=Clostridium beijerinckii TaxID=1520 RepID=A0AAX0B7E3_CLOBE|nr:hypothetical protein [Clostridium beijerinckii]MBA8932502.1 hypothetical protein [Clostridium beijerinckii]NRT37536.1 hypothetical protein [Clostridium beijerinckii]NRT48722.1 hypothetical protein [Clostridium beijerinckii]NRT90764.1 hypothetical protein [Clostridium beijerinckii]NRU36706.1 hypothetical protein [Clostridium beijerinckii]
MRYEIENLKDISDSKEIMKSYSYSYSYKLLKYIVYIIGLLLICIIIWSVFAKKDILVNASGIAYPQKNICNIYIENTSFGNIKEGDKVSLEIVSLPKSRYGIITSTLENISNDVVSSENGERKYYTAVCKLDKATLVDKNGDDADIKNGMEISVKIITGEVSYFKYFLEKLNIFN